MSKKRIDPKYYGSRFRIPTVTGCVIWLMLDRLQASGLVCGIAWTVFAVLALGLMLAPFGEDWVHPKDV